MVRYSFHVGLSHPLLDAGLSRRFLHLPKSGEGYAAFKFAQSDSHSSLKMERRRARTWGMFSRFQRAPVTL